LLTSGKVSIESSSEQQRRPQILDPKSEKVHRQGFGPKTGMGEKGFCFV